MNTCYCEVPWTGRPLPKWMRDRAHVRRDDCQRPVIRKAEWLRRKDAGQLRPKELTY